MINTEKLSWERYARKYDMLLSYNPFYQQLHKKVLELTGEWPIHDGARIADIGAGTGNYSLALAQKFPQAEILHIDNDKGMNTICAQKRAIHHVSNHQILQADIENTGIEEGSLSAIVSIHALYTLPNPQEVLNHIYHWLKPGGMAILVDAGRVINILSWQIAISWHLIKTYGIRKTIEIFREAKEVSRQNSNIRKLQREGIFWTHSHEEFCAVIEKVGFQIIRSEQVFRGDSDLVLAKKPLSQIQH